MRNIIIIAIIAFGGYKVWDHLANQPAMAYDESGNPLTLVFTFDGCKPCTSATKLLDERDIDYTEYNLQENEDNLELMKSYGGKRNLPYIVTGNLTLSGYQQDELVGALAEVYGWEVLKRAEQRLLRQNFDDSGNPVIVMYATEKCGYCKKARQYFEEQGVPYTERDVEKDRSASNDYRALKASGTPLIYVGTRRISGFNQEKLDEALKLL